MTRNDAGLTGLVAHFAAYAVCILDSNVEEVLLPSSIVVCYSCLAEVAEVIEFMAEVFHAFPALRTSPFVRLIGVLGTRSIEIAVRLLT